jgi:hypothetical protein
VVSALRLFRPHSACVSANAHALARYVDGSHTIEALRRGHRGRSSRTLRNLINSLMKSVGEHGEFRIELGGVLHYGTYMVTKPGEIVEVRVTPLKKRLRKSLSTVKPQSSSRWSSATSLRKHRHLPDG